MEELTEELSTAQMAERAGVTQRTVQRWIKSGELQAKPIRGGYYAINPLDLVELSLPLRADATPKEKRLGQAEDKIERLNRRVTELTRERKTTTTRRKKRDTSKLLPYDYTPWRAFARLHGIPESTVARAIKEQTLYVERGNWKSGGRTVTEAFDYHERELFYDHFHTHPKFESCEDCPHKLK